MFSTQKIDDQVKTETYSNSTLTKKTHKKKHCAGIGLDQYRPILRIFGIGSFLKKMVSFPNLNAFNCPADGAAIKFVHRYQDNSTFINDVLENNLLVVYLGNSLRPFM